MASYLGLDFSKNQSLITVPIAWVLAHGPHLYTVISCIRDFDNRNPRTMKDNILKDKRLDEKTKQFFIRAKNASENAYETLGLFAAGVAVANAVGVDNKLVNGLSWGYLASRVVYTFIYMKLGERKGLTELRSLVWTMGIFMSLGFFVAAGRKVNGS